VPASTETTSPDTAGTYDAIVRTALDLFFSEGYEGTSMKAIATRVGITTPALYWHFSSKQALFLAALMRELDDFLEAMLGQVTSDDPVEALSQLTRAHVLRQLENTEVAAAYHQSFGFRGLIEKLPDDIRDEVRTRERRYVDELRRILSAGKRTGAFQFDDVKVTAFAVITLCDFVNSWYAPGGKYSPERIARMHVPMVLGMVGHTGSATCAKPVRTSSRRKNPDSRG
jgi:AcrR family transcriptional regulator